MLFGIFALIIITAHVMIFVIICDKLITPHSIDNFWKPEATAILCFIGWLITLPFVMRLLEIIDKAL